MLYNMEVHQHANSNSEIEYLGYYLSNMIDNMMPLGNNKYGTAGLSTTITINKDMIVIETDGDLDYYIEFISEICDSWEKSVYLGSRLIKEDPRSSALQKAPLREVWGTALPLPVHRIGGESGWEAGHFGIEVFYYKGNLEDNLNILEGLGYKANACCYANFNGQYVLYLRKDSNHAVLYIDTNMHIVAYPNTSGIRPECAVIEAFK